MKLFRLFVFVGGAILMSSICSAGVKIGNGGMIAYCAPSIERKVERIELPDFLEARFRWDLKLKLFSENIEWKTQVKMALDRLRQRSPARAQQYNAWLETFTQDSKFVDGFELPSTNDAVFLPIPLNCELKQAVVQIAPEVPRDKRYYINLAIWNELSESQKAGLVLHELIYREAQKNSFEDSKWVRYFNAMIWADAVSEANHEDWARLFIDLLKVDYFEWSGFKAQSLATTSNKETALSLVSQRPPILVLKHLNLEQFESGEIKLNSIMQITSMTFLNATVLVVSEKEGTQKIKVAKIDISDFNSSHPQVKFNFLRNGDFEVGRSLSEHWLYDAESFTYGYFSRSDANNRDGVLNLRRGAVSRVCQSVVLFPGKYLFKIDLAVSNPKDDVYFELLDFHMQSILKQTQRPSARAQFEIFTHNFEVSSQGDYYICESSSTRSTGSWIRVDDLVLSPQNHELRSIQ
jgi:hypothetical protein